jgi:membrane protein DedA with SNARE-associated domain
MYSVQMRVTLQILVGLALWVSIIAVLTYSAFPFFWEHEDAPHVYSLTWRSAIVALALLAASQWIVARIVRTIHKTHE